MRKLYFINEIVEWLLTQYIWTGCTDVGLRDKIMQNATELIRQIIRKQGLHTIYPGQEESAMGDLQQTAWVQVERVLYKYRSRPHCRSCFNYDRPSDSLLYLPQATEYGIITIEEVIELHGGVCPKCKSALRAGPMVEPVQGTYGGTTTILYRGMSKVFNMWSQVSRTVILAYIKKEGRDRKNSNTYAGHLSTKTRQNSDAIDRFLMEAVELCKYNDDHLAIIDGIRWLIENDDRPHDCMLGKLADRINLPRNVITSFLRTLKLRSLEFTDSPLNRKNENLKYDKRQNAVFDPEDD